MAGKGSTSHSSRKPAVVGIDIGSVGSRAYIYCPSTNSGDPVLNPYQVQAKYRTPKFEKGDFSSNAYPFDADPDRLVYLGEVTDVRADRESISLKYAPYILVDCADDLLRQYALLGSLLGRKQDESFRSNLWLGLQRLFETIFDRVHGRCRAQNMVITDIALTIPAQWSLEFEELYVDIVSPLSGVDRTNIYFCTETEALANCLLRCHAEDMRKMGLKDQSTLIFLDFGGHNMNGCVFEAVSGESDMSDMSFFRVGEPFGAGGGSEHWEDNIDRLGSPYVGEVYSQNITSQRRQLLGDGFCRERANIGPEIYDKDVMISLEENPSTKHQVLLPKAVVNQAWEDAHSRVLDVAARQIAQFTNKEGVIVILSGGTARHGTLQRRMAKICKDAKLPEPFHTDKFEIAFNTAIVAKGAAYAVGQRITAQQFFERGGSIGLHQKQGAENPEGLWNNEAAVLARMNLAKDVAFSITSHDDELQLVCEPNRSAAEGTNNLHYTRSYKLLALGNLPIGRYKYTCKIEGSGDNVELELKRFKRCSSVARPSQATREMTGSFGHDFWRRDATSRIPVYFEPGANCVLVGQRGQAVGDLDIPGIPRVADAATMDTTSGLLQIGGTRHRPWIQLWV